MWDSKKLRPLSTMECFNKINLDHCVPTIIEKNFITLPTQDVSEEKASLMTSVINSFLIYFLIRHPFYVIYESLWSSNEELGYLLEYSTGEKESEQSFSQLKFQLQLSPQHWAERGAKNGLHYISLLKAALKAFIPWAFTDIVQSI